MKNLLVAATILAMLPLSQVSADFTPITGWDKQLFPSFIIGTATMKGEDTSTSENELGDVRGLLGVEVVATMDNASIEVTIECNEFIEPSKFSGRLPKKGETYSIYPKVKYRFDKLSQCNQATPATITFRVKVEGSETEEKSANVTFRSINDCPLKLALGEQVIDTSFAFASYVNEQHPFMDKLLREALDIGVVDSFTGYQSGSDEEVLRQVYAIWDLLVARDVRYSSITTTAADSDIVLSQNVRLLEDTVNNQQANCVDGSVLFVSLLRKIDIESNLILVPGHCYMGFYLDREKTKFLALETTLVGVEVDLPEEVDEILENSVDEDLRGDYSWPSFVQAIELGTKNLLASKEKFEDKSEADYNIIDIASARKVGVLPIPHRGKEKFVQFDHSAYIGLDSDESMDSDEEADDEDDDE